MMRRCPLPWRQPPLQQLSWQQPPRTLWPLTWLCGLARLLWLDEAITVCQRATVDTLIMFIAGDRGCTACTCRAVCMYRLYSES
jgi:hypothetical protein